MGVSLLAGLTYNLRIMPNWIEYFESDEMIPVSNRFGIIEPSDDGLDIDNVFVITA